ncbi:MAG TPA: molybdopterin-dependent oxidoreductase [Steroidobacteraceae bacterium]|jgi:assimilatory nitrate reductase catalytic subunit|nr:molybdopterin-dependent oxidoreductase [Steroidobacteraceae bacterium]
MSQAIPRGGNSGLPDVVRTTCPYCGVGCGVVARRSADGAIGITGDPRHPANRGSLCSKGSALAETLGTGGRLLHPVIRTRRSLPQLASSRSATRSSLAEDRQVGWGEALSRVAQGFAAAVREHGPDSVAFYVSGQLSTEDYYVANKLMKGFIGSANIDTNSRLCMASAVAGHRRAFGEDLVPGCYEDLELADLIVLVGSNTAWCHPVLFRRIEKERQRRPELKIAVIDPRRTPTAEMADLHLPIRAGTDVTLFNGLLWYLQQHGQADQRFVDEHTTGAPEALAAARSASDPAGVAAICGTDAQRIGELYRLFSSSERVVTLFSQGVNQSSAGTDKVNAIINCHLLTGRIGRPGMGPFSLTGQPNAMGGREVGGLANALAAHLDLEAAEHREAVQAFWGSPSLASRQGLKAVDLFEAVHAGRIKAVWIMATNPVVSLPDADRVREALRRCDMVVLSDCVGDSDTAALAHVLLPAATWGEKDGTVTNSERRISRQRRFLTAPGEARPDWWIISEVAKRMGFAEGFTYDSPHQIFDEHARLSALAARVRVSADSRCGDAAPRLFDLGGLAGLGAAGYEQLEPIQWPVGSPCDSASDSRSGRSTARLFQNGRFAHPDGRARFIPVHQRAPANSTDEAHPFVLNTGRIRDQWHTMTRTGRAPRLTEHLPEPFADLHPHDALACAIREGELARVSTQWGSMVVRTRTSGEVSRGTVFVPMHWSDTCASEARVGALVSPAVDPISGEPEFKHTPASVELFPVEWHGVVLARRPIATREMTWWALVRGQGFLRYELAGRKRPADWAQWVRALLEVPTLESDYLEYSDAASGIYRAAYVAGDRLEGYAYFSPRPELPARGWLASLFAKENLSACERLALLAGRPLQPADDAGPLVCSCFAVGRNTLSRLIDSEGLTNAQQVGERLRAGTSCGSCLPEIGKLLKGCGAGSAARSSGNSEEAR